MAEKVTFDPQQREIIVTEAPVDGVVTLDFRRDVYSAGKHDWLSNAVLSRFVFPFQAIGGNSLPGGLVVDSLYFVKSPWKIRPYDADHELVLTGNVFTDDGSGLALPRTGRTITVRLITTFSQGSSPAGIATAVHGDARSLTVGKFIALK